MFKRINKKIVDFRTNARMRRDTRELLSLNDDILQDIGFPRHEILAKLAA